MGKSFKYILFDWDGNLAMSLTNALNGYRTVFEQYGVTITDAEIVKRAFGNWHVATEFGLPNEEFNNKFIAFINEKMPTVPLYAGVKDTLEKLKKRDKKMAIVTSSKRETVLPALRNLGLENFFDSFLGKEDFVKEKPDPEVLLKAMAELGAIKEETIIIGDSNKDVGAGKNAGITTVLFYPTENELFYKHAELQNLHADFLITDFTELLDIVN